MGVRRGSHPTYHMAVCSYCGDVMAEWHGYARPLPQNRPTTKSRNIGEGYRQHGGGQRWPREAASWQGADKCRANAQEKAQGICMTDFAILGRRGSFVRSTREAAAFIREHMDANAPIVLDRLEKGTSIKQAQEAANAVRSWIANQMEATSGAGLQNKSTIRHGARIVENQSCAGEIASE